jgi:hypothetical protein
MNFEYINNILQKSIFNEKFRVNFFLHGLIMFTFLTVFFYVFLSKELFGAFSGQLNSQLNNALKNIPPKYNLNNNLNSLNLNKDAKTLVKKGLDNYKQLYDKPDIEVENANNALIRNVFLVNAVLWGLFILYVIGTKFVFHHEVNIFHIVLENLATFAVIGYAEYYFFMNYAMAYPPVTPNYISTQIIDLLKTKIST